MLADDVHNKLDEIILATLYEDLDTSEGLLEKFADGGWMHADDVKYHKKLIKAINRLIEYRTVMGKFEE